MNTRNGFEVIALLSLLLTGAPVLAQPPQLFTQGSHAQILAEYRDHPLVLAFWSLNCSHCVEELSMLGELSRAHPQATIVLVSTDTPAEAPGVEAMLRQYGLAHVASWVFANEAPERLRFEVDRRWRGELPRTYLIAPGAAPRTFSGQVKRDELEHWLRTVLISR